MTDDRKGPENLRAPASFPVSGAGPVPGAPAPGGTGGDEDGLELFFAAARASAPVPSAALLARIAADAEAVRPRAMPGVAPAARPRPATAPRGAPEGRLAALAALLGGWRGMGGLATAALAGVWIGFAAMDADGGARGFVGSAFLGGGLDDSLGTVTLFPDDDLLTLAMADG